MFSVAETCGKLDKQVVVIRLDLCLGGRLVTDGLAAFVAAVDDYIALLGVGQGLYRAENAAALE